MFIIFCDIKTFIIFLRKMPYFRVIFLIIIDTGEVSQGEVKGKYTEEKYPIRTTLTTIILIVELMLYVEVI